MADRPKNLLTNLDTTPVLVSQAKGGSINAAQEVLQLASDFIARGEPLPDELAAWISQGLKKLAAGEDANTIFSLRRRCGAPSKYGVEFERLVADSIFYSKAGRHKAINKAGAGQGAYATAAAFFGIAENTAEKFYKKYVKTILIETQLQREFAEDHRTD